ncbi:hypothetical protein [Marivita hallyeonensis]|uniref:Uncharacterized protein n=1 Tax=Marivita hallyeonensis TaxID=996342 RepID=A0A1M5W6Z2_9RHOB|nr:hypothetical protein [Marivita hallyeonensis]SHH83240.1 hypothetical protein SAMN05443551_3292 [Marivita hallyeonensis]
MTERYNKLAWVAAALAVLVWAFVPHLVSANVVVFPQVPTITVSDLPPVALDPETSKRADKGASHADN